MEKKSVVVMGGSFNPPTIAHLKIMQKALEAVNAEKGFLVPVSFPYLKRKMVKAGQSHLCLPDDLRLSMLEAMIASDPRLEIDTGEMGEPFAITSVTMERAQKKYPGARIYFVAGADKLSLLEEFQRKWAFLARYGVIVFSRNGGELMKELAEHELLNAFQSSIVTVDPPVEVEGVSSTRIREHLFDADAVADMMHPSVLPMLRKLKKEDYPEEILQFKGDYAFLSNDYPADVTYEGIAYPCAASAFLASKFADPEQKKAIAQMPPEKAKQRYSAIPGRSDWQKCQTAVMEEVVSLKFRQHPELKEMLAATGQRRLINGSKKDTYWGVNPITWKGENRLGLILMKIRNE